VTAEVVTKLYYFFKKNEITNLIYFFLLISFFFLKKSKLNYIKIGTKRTQHHRSTPPLNPTAAAPDSSIKRTQQHHPAVIEPAF
jgi:hypothetical protein